MIDGASAAVTSSRGVLWEFGGRSVRLSRHVLRSVIVLGEGEDELASGGPVGKGFEAVGGVGPRQGQPDVGVE